MNTTEAATRRAMLALPGPLTAAVGRAQASWPDRPVRLLIGYPPGGPTGAAPVRSAATAIAAEVPGSATARPGGRAGGRRRRNRRRRSRPTAGQSADLVAPRDTSSVPVYPVNRNTFAGSAVNGRGARSRAVIAQTDSGA